MQSDQEHKRSKKKAWLVFSSLLMLLAMVGTYVALAGDDTGGKIKKKPGSDVLGFAEEGLTALPNLLKPKADTQAPDVTVSFPVAGGNYGAGAWDGGCPVSPGICGSDSDPSGVASVEFSIRRQGGNYWSGTAFDSNAPLFLLLPAPGATWSYPFARPADGTYVVAVKATDTKGNTTPANKLVTRTFQIDATPPVAPVIVQHPDDVTFDQSAGFRFDHPESKVTFRCQLDDGAPAVCKRDVNYKDLSTSDHRLRVWAVDAAGNAGPPAEYSWTILIRRNFGIEGDANQRLSLGASTALDAKISNPFKFPLRVVEMSVMATGPASCPADVNLETVVSSFAVPVVIPANSARTLSDLKIPPAQWPQLRMKNRNVNQDGCKNVTFHLTYTGTGTKS